MKMKVILNKMQSFSKYNDDMSTGHASFFILHSGQAEKRKTH